MYAGLTTADKGALLDAKADGASWIARDANGFLYGYTGRPKKRDNIDEWDYYQLGERMKDPSQLLCIQWFDSEPVNIDLALAQIAEMESEPETIYGYPIELLQKVAALLRDERMTISDLKKCVDNFTYCAEMTLKMIRADTEASLAQSIADMQNFYSPYTEGETT